ncbi:TPA: tail fiber assembly protein [Kluyvera cryocrescens]|nr:tail fiber assembly protein [Kluyvera cryocrescens]
MIHLKNFTEYKPSSETEKQLVYPGIPVLFLRSDDGIDWYQAQTSFKKDTMKIAYDINGVIAGYSTDVSTLVPYDCSVVEMQLKDVPDGMTNDSTWQYVDGLITKIPIDYVAIATAEKKSLRVAADKEIAWLSDAVDAGIATEQEASSLAQWRTYRVLLMRVNPEDGAAIVWPPVPTAI